MRGKGSKMIEWRLTKTNVHTGCTQREQCKDIDLLHYVGGAYEHVRRQFSALSVCYA
jgi:hypothetical protein